MSDVLEILNEAVRILEAEKETYEFIESRW